MRPMIRTNAPIAPPATAGPGIGDLALELTCAGTLVLEVVSLLIGGGLGVGALGEGVSVGCNESVVEGGSDEEGEDEAG